MRKPEQKLWDSMRRQAPVNLWLQRIENRVAAGMPDIVCMFMRHTSWVELKAAKLPQRKETRVLGNDGLNQDQINWHILCYQQNCISFILVRDDAMNLYLIPGRHAAIINSASQDMLQELSCAEDWTGIFDWLITRK